MQTLWRRFLRWQTPRWGAALCKIYIVSAVSSYLKELPPLLSEKEIKKMNFTPFRLFLFLQIYCQCFSPPFKFRERCQMEFFYGPRFYYHFIRFCLKLGRKGRRTNEIVSITTGPEEIFSFFVVIYDDKPQSINLKHFYMECSKITPIGWQYRI